MNKRGSVLIFVLIFIAFILSIVTVMHQHSGDSLYDSANLQYEHQSAIYAMSAIEVIKKILEDDDNLYDADNEPWALIPPFPVDNGFISINVTPVDGRFPLNLLDSDNKSYNKGSEFYLAGCKGIMTELELDDSICSVIKDWIDTDNEVSNMGEENVLYETDGRSFTTKNGKLETLKELLFIDRAKSDFNTLAKHFTNVGDGKLNVNYASKEALKGLLPDLAPYVDRIVEYRANKTFKDISNLMDAASIPQEVYNASLDYIGVKSSLFYVKTEVSLGGKSRFYHVLIERSGTKTNLLKYIEGNDGIFF